MNTSCIALLLLSTENHQNTTWSVGICQLHCTTMLARAIAPTARLMARGAATTRAASTLVVAEHNNAELNAATLSAVSAAKAIGGDVRLPRASCLH